MRGSYKKFDKELYKQNDRIAKTLTKDLLLKEFGSLGASVMENPDQYGVDLWLVRNGNIQTYVECEIKLVWNSYNFPYNTVQFPERKKKFTGLGKPVLFCMINKDKNRMLTIWCKDLLASPLVEVPNKYKSSGELFFQVPTSKVTFYDI